MSAGMVQRGPGVLPLDADKGGGYGPVRNARDRVLESTAVGPGFMTPDQRAWLNNAKAWGSEDVGVGPEHQMTTVSFDEAGAEYRDLVADGVGWRDTQPPGTGSLWKVQKA